MKLELSKKSGNFELIIWTVYYLLMFTIGRYENLKQPIIWGGGILVFGLSAPFVYHNFKLIPKESLFLLALWFWSLTGGLVAINMDGYLHYLRMIAQMTLVIIFFGTVCRNTHLLDIFIGAMVIPPIFIFADMLINRQSSAIIMDLAMQTSADRAFGLANDPNTFGVMCCIGIWAALFLITKYKSKFFRLVLIPVSLFLIYGILLSASRSAFIVGTLEIVAWFVFCLPEKVAIKGLRLFIICLLIVGFLVSLKWVFDNTVLGARSTRAIEQAGEESRVQLILLGLELFSQSPIIGHGLAQFVELSPTHHYSHNDLIELLATTGFPGACLYYLIYLSCFSKLWKTLKYYKKTPQFYHLVMILILLGILLASGMFNVNFASMECSFWLAIILGQASYFNHATKLKQELS